jgi:predicted dehydrogenase
MIGGTESRTCPGLDGAGTLKRNGGTHPRVGIVGAGLMGTWHAARWKQLPVELAGFFDPVAEMAGRAAAGYGGQVFDRLEALLAVVDVVDVCSPTPYHLEHVLAAAAAGRDVLCEKPLARHLRDAEEMVDACEAAGVRLFVGQVVRFFEQYAHAKALLDEGALGRPGVIRTVRGGEPPDPDRRPWFHDFRQSGGVIMDVSIHDLDFCRWCFGDVERLFARGLTFSGAEPYDQALILLRFKNSALGHVEGSWAYPPGRFRTGYEIAGDRGLAAWDSLDPEPVAVTLKPSRKGESASLLAPRDDPYLVELAHFLRCLESGEAFRVTARDGLEAVRLSLAAIESIRTGRPIDLDDFEEAT